MGEKQNDSKTIDSIKLIETIYKEAEQFYEYKSRFSRFIVENDGTGEKDNNTSKEADSLSSPISTLPVLLSYLFFVSFRIFYYLLFFIFKDGANFEFFSDVKIIIALSKLFEGNQLNSILFTLFYSVFLIINVYLNYKLLFGFLQNKYYSKAYKKIILTIFILIIIAHIFQILFKVYVGKDLYFVFESEIYFLVPPWMQILCFIFIFFPFYYNVSMFISYIIIEIVPFVYKWAIDLQKPFSLQNINDFLTDKLCQK